jgi:hypothetical protein
MEIDMPFPPLAPSREQPARPWKPRPPLLSLLGFALALGLSSGESIAEPVGLLSLELPVGPRATGMGSAFVSVANDPTAMYWNPAGLTRLGAPEKHFDILFQHNEWLSDMRQEYIAAGTRFGGKHAVGGSFSGFYMGDLEGRDENGRPTVDFGVYDVVVTGSYAYQVHPSASLGGSLKYIVANIDDLTHFAFAGDLGTQIEVAPDLRVGAAVTNLGEGLTFIEDQNDLPTAFQVGGSYLLPYDLANGSLLVALDVRKMRDDDAHVLFGTEYDHAGVAQVQLGYRTGWDNDGINFGLGAAIGTWRLGYAVVPFDSDLGSTHRFSVGFRL